MCVLEWNKRVSFQKTSNWWQYAAELVSVLKWNKRGSFQKQNKKHQFITVCYSTFVRIEMKQEGSVFKKIQLMTICCWTCVRNETRGQFSKNNNLLQYAIQQEEQFSKTNNLLLYAIQLVCVLKWNKRDSFQKQNKKHQFITVCYSTRGAVLKNNNLLLPYDIQLVCILKWNKRDSFQQQKKTQIYYSMLFNLCAYWNETRWTVIKKIQLMTICYWTCVRNETRGAVFQKWQQFITVGAIQLVSVMKWNKRGSFQKTTIYYCMLFNLCVYWNETRGAVFKNKTKNTNLLQYAIQQEGHFSKNNNLLLYDIQLVCILKWNKRDSFQQKKKHKFITVCYSTCARIEMKQDGQFSKKSN